MRVSLIYMLQHLANEFQTRFLSHIIAILCKSHKEVNECYIPDDTRTEAASSMSYSICSSARKLSLIVTYFYFLQDCYKFLKINI